MGCNNEINNDNIPTENNIDDQNDKNNNLNQNKYYCYTQKEISQIENLLKKRTYENNEIIFYKAFIKIIDNNYTQYTEFLTIQTDKIDGKEYSSEYEFISNTIRGEVEKCTLKINNKNITNFQIPSSFHNFYVKTTYNLEENESSIVTFELNAKVKTFISLYLTRINFFFKGQAFSFRIKFSNYFSFSHIYPKPKNNFNIISYQEILFTGKQLENEIIFIFKMNGKDIEILKDDKSFYYCDDDEIKELKLSLNSMKLNFDEINIFGVKEIYNISKGICTVKTYITFIKPRDLSLNDSGNFLYYIGEKKDLKIISLKQDNQNKEFKLSNGSLDLSYDYCKLEYFSTFEVDYSFSLVDENNKLEYIIPIGNKDISEGAYYQFFIKYDEKEINDFFFEGTMAYRSNDCYQVIFKIFYKSKNINGFLNYLHLCYK